MMRVFFILVSFLLTTSCSTGPDLWTKHGAYAGSEAAAIDVACHKRGKSNKESLAWKLCVQSQKLHYK